MFVEKKLIYSYFALTFKQFLLTQIFNTIFNYKNINLYEN